MGLGRELELVQGLSALLGVGPLIETLRAAIVPHAPLLLPELESAEVAASARVIRTAVEAIDLRDAETIVLLSPHGIEEGDNYFGFYEDVNGALTGFGDLPVQGRATTDIEATEFLGRSSDWSVREGPPDHGVVVPLALRSWPVPVAAGTFIEQINLDAIDEVARDYALAILDLASRRKVMLIASVNMTAGLSPRAPLTELPTAQVAEDELVRAITTDLGTLDWDRVLKPLWAAGSCGLGPLQVLGECLAGQSMEVLAHEAPVGVGYLVAQTV